MNPTSGDGASSAGGPSNPVQLPLTVQPGSHIFQPAPYPFLHTPHFPAPGQALYPQPHQLQHPLNPPPHHASVANPLSSYGAFQGAYPMHMSYAAQPQPLGQPWSPERRTFGAEGPRQSELGVTGGMEVGVGVLGRPPSTIEASFPKTVTENNEGGIAATMTAGGTALSHPSALYYAGQQTVPIRNPSVESGTATWLRNIPPSSLPHLQQHQVYSHGGSLASSSSTTSGSLLPSAAESLSMPSILVGRGGGAQRVPQVQGSTTAALDDKMSPSHTNPSVPFHTSRAMPPPTHHLESVSTSSTHSNQQPQKPQPPPLASTTGSTTPKDRLPDPLSPPPPPQPPPTPLSSANGREILYEKALQKQRERQEAWKCSVYQREAFYQKYLRWCDGDTNEFENFMCPSASAAAGTGKSRKKGFDIVYKKKKASKAYDVANLRYSGIVGLLGGKLECFCVCVGERKTETGVADSMGPRGSDAELERVFSFQEVLVPIRIDLDIEGIKFRDTLTWNLNEPLLTPIAFAEVLCEDMKLPKAAFAAEIERVIKDQLEDFASFGLPPESVGKAGQRGSGSLEPAALRRVAVTEADEEEHNATNDDGEPDEVEDAESDGQSSNGGRPGSRDSGEGKSKGDGTEVCKTATVTSGLSEMRIIIRLDITVGDVCLVDQFEWDCSSPDSDPERFAAVTCKDLGLGGEFQTAMAHAIREQVFSHVKTVRMVGGLSAGTGLILTADVAATLEQNGALGRTLLRHTVEPSRSPELLDGFSPSLIRLTPEQHSKLLKSWVRDSRRKHRTSRQRRSRSTLPDLEALHTERTILGSEHPACVFPFALPGGGGFDHSTREGELKLFARAAEGCCRAGGVGGGGGSGSIGSGAGSCGNTTNSAWAGAGAWTGTGTGPVLRTGRRGRPRAGFVAAAAAAAPLDSPTPLGSPFSSALSHPIPPFTTTGAAAKLPATAASSASSSVGGYTPLMPLAPSSRYRQSLD